MRHFIIAAILVVLAASSVSAAPGEEANVEAIRLHELVLNDPQGFFNNARSWAIDEISQSNIRHTHNARDRFEMANCAADLYGSHYMQDPISLMASLDNPMFAEPSNVLRMAILQCKD